MDGKLKSKSRGRYMDRKANKGGEDEEEEMKVQWVQRK